MILLSQFKSQEEAEKILELYKHAEVVEETDKKTGRTNIIFIIKTLDAQKPSRKWL